MVGVAVSSRPSSDGKLTLKLQDKNGPHHEKVREGRRDLNEDNGDKEISLNKENILNNFWKSISKVAKAEREAEDFGAAVLDCKARSAMFHRMLFKPPQSGSDKVNCVYL